MRHSILKLDQVELSETYHAWVLIILTINVEINKGKVIFAPKKRMDKIKYSFGETIALTNGKKYGFGSKDIDERRFCWL